MISPTQETEYKKHFAKNVKLIYFYFNIIYFYIKNINNYIDIIYKLFIIINNILYVTNYNINFHQKEVKSLPNIPTHCPACNATMNITELRCSKCSTKVQGNFPMNKLISLSEEDREFLMTFLRSRGNIKEVQERMGISYPTVKNRLDKLLTVLGLFDEVRTLTRSEIINAINKGVLSVEEAINLLKER